MRICETDGDTVKHYFYDAKTGMTALYLNRREDAENVYGDNFSEYKPDLYISPADYSIYDGGRRSGGKYGIKSFLPLHL